MQPVMSHLRRTKRSDSRSRKRGIQPMLVRDDKATVPTVLFAAFNCPGQRSVCTPEGVIIGFALVTGEERYRGEGIGRSIRDGIRQEPYKLVYMGLLPASLGIPF